MLFVGGTIITAKAGKGLEFDIEIERSRLNKKNLSTAIEDYLEDNYERNADGDFIFPQDEVSIYYSRKMVNFRLILFKKKNLVSVVYDESDIKIEENGEEIVYANIKLIPDEKDSFTKGTDKRKFL